MLATAVESARGAQGLSFTIPIRRIDESPLDVIKRMSGRDYKTSVYKSQIDDACERVLEFDYFNGKPAKILDSNKLDDLIFGLSGVFEENITPLATRFQYSNPHGALESLFSSSFVLSKAYGARSVSDRANSLDRDFAVAYRSFFIDLTKTFFPYRPESLRPRSFSPFSGSALKCVRGDLKGTAIVAIKELLEIDSGITDLRKQEREFQSESASSIPSDANRATATLARLDLAPRTPTRTLFPDFEPNTSRKKRGPQSGPSLKRAQPQSWSGRTLFDGLPQE